MRKDLQDYYDRKTLLDDESRPKAVEKRHAKGKRTARENIHDLCDADSFLEYGSLIVAGQRGRKSEEDLMRDTPADGLVAGVGQVNSDNFSAEDSMCAVLSYDYTVLAGTQGGFNHRKTDRMLELARQAKIPVVFYVEGGGGRPGDVDFEFISSGGLNIPTFVEYGRLSGIVPRVAIVSGYCFAGNAAIAGCSDVIIATEDSNLGMGGPAMIEGGGLGRFHPRDIGPAADQYKNGVIDILVKDEVEATAVAKKYLSYFQGSIKEFTCSDQTKLQELIPENRKFAYDVHKVIEHIADTDSVLELRAGYAHNMVTALIRVEGRPMGLIANSTRHLGGAIDSAAADKASRFMLLCDAHGLPILSLCDAPGFMVGPECESTAMVRHSSRMFITGSRIEVPIFTIFLRKAYGLGAMAMAGGSFHESQFSIAWPTAEFGAMGLEGAVKLGFKKELEATENIQAKQQLYETLVKKAYHQGKAIKAASKLEFDEVIDPKDTRQWILSGLLMMANQIKPSGRMVDSW